MASARSRRRLLRSLMYKDCATAILTEVFDGVLNRLEEGAGDSLSAREEIWLHDEIGRIADRFITRGQRQEEGM